MRRRFIATAALLCTAAPLAAQTHWSYAGATGPSRWGSLSSQYATCDTGRAQSPIDLPLAAVSSPTDVSGTYARGEGALFNNGHTVQMNVGAGSSITLGGRTFELVQFHFHHPSEHTLDGRRYPAEVHLVHRNASGTLAVLGIFVQTGAANPAWTELLAKLPHEEGDTVRVSADPVRLFGLANLGAQTVRTYPGSLTTPPCTEDVSWVVRSRVIQLSAHQMTQLRAAFHENARPVQPRNGRTVHVRRH
jgi:carbonic anhydrase